jgi:hypothetical protein
MSYKTPTRGNMLQLWDKLSPDQGYSREEIEKIAKESNIGDYTVGNLLNTRRKYLILKKDTQLYYRNDSELSAQIAAPPKTNATKPAKTPKAKSATTKSTASSKRSATKPAASKPARAKSTKNATTTQSPESKPEEPVNKLEISAESIAQKIFESTQRLKEAKLRKDKVSTERAQLELEENNLISEITELEASLKSIQLFL